MANSSLSLNNIINVTISLSATGSPGPSFNQALIVGPSTVISAATRVQQFTSASAMLTAGFSPTSPEYLSASIYFAQSATYLWVGVQVASAIATVTAGAAGGTGYAVGDILGVTQVGGSGGQVKVTSVSSGAVTGVAVVSGAQGSGYSVGTNLATTVITGSGNGSATVNITAIGETPLQAVVACRAASQVWYALHVTGPSVTDADRLAVAGYVESCSPPAVYFVGAGTSPANILNNVTGNLFATLQAQNYRRTNMLYSTTQGGAYPNQIYAAAAAMGMAMGLNNGSSGSYFTMAYKTLIGVVPEPLTQAQALAICGSADRSSPGLNGNAFLSFASGAYNLLCYGTQAGGLFFDSILFTDLLASAIQTNAMNLLTGVPALPITDQGVAQMAGAVTQACVASQALGFIAPSGTWKGATIGTGNNKIASGSALPKGYWVYAPPVSTLTQGQRAARQLPPITVALIESQAGQSLNVTVNVQQ